MSKIVILYTSMSGNTEIIANLVAEGIREQGIEPSIIDVMSSPPASTLLDFDGILIGSYTWGDGELPDDFLDFYDEMENLDLTGKKAAVFGSGDRAYLEFCAAVDIFETKLQERGAKLVQEGLKIELSPTDKEKTLCKAFGTRFTQEFIAIDHN